MRIAWNSAICRNVPEASGVSGGGIDASPGEAAAESPAAPPGTRSAAMDPRRRMELELLGHDLRAAVADVTGGLSILAGAHLPGPMRVQVNRARRAGETVARLIDRALLALGEAPVALYCPPEPVDLIAVLDTVEARWAGRAAERGLEFELWLAPGTIGMIRADGVALERVLSNLVGNAVLHSTRGRIRLEVTPQADGAPVFKVIDDGPGFPADALLPCHLPGDGPPPTAAAPRSRSDGAGSGMGLYIVRDLARHMGATLSLANRPGGGAEVRLALPSEALPDLPETPEAMPDLTGCRILVAEDSTSQRQAMVGLLRSLGATVEAVPGGAAAVLRLSRGGLDVALVDIEMPDMPGPSVIAALRAMPGPEAAIPVVAVTAHAAANRHRDALASGADAVILKPVVCPVALGLSILSVLARRQSAVPGPAVAPENPPVAVLPASDLDTAVLARLLHVFGPATGAEFLRRLDADLAGVAAALRAARAGLATDVAALRASTHVLVALAGTAGARRLHALAQTLQGALHDGQDGHVPDLLDRLCPDLDILVDHVRSLLAADAALPQAMP